MTTLGLRTGVPLLLLALVLSGCAGSSTSDTTSGSTSGGVSGGGGGVGQCTASSATPSAAPADAVPASADAQVVAGAADAAATFLETLSADQQSGVLFDYTDLDTKRCSWSNFPDGAFTGRVGARMGDLSEAQRAAAMEAVQSLMSAAGYETVQGIMASDDFAAQSQGGGGGASFGSDNYHLAFYGDPASDTTWSMQFGGHHLNILISVGPGTLSVSPHFKGVDPVTFTLDGTDYAPMKADADDMFGLFGSLDDTALATAELAGSFDDLVMGPGTDTGYPDQAGLAYGDLTTDQQGLVTQVIADWVADAAPELAQPLIDLYGSQLDQTTIGWSGSIDATEPAYFRIDGPRVWIEWINTSNGDPAIHYHTLYRDKLLDYGTGTS